MAKHRSFEEKLAIVDYYLEHGALKTTDKQFDVYQSMINEWVLMVDEPSIVKAI